MVNTAEDDVWLNDADMAWGEREGLARYRRRIRARGRDGAGATEWSNIFGMRCELAAARYLHVEGFRFAPWAAPDVRPDIEVRGASQVGHRLRAYESDDPAARYLLVEGRVDSEFWPGNRFRMCGWLPGLHVMSGEFWVERPGWRAWLVPNTRPPLWHPATLDPRQPNRHV